MSSLFIVKVIAIVFVLRAVLEILSIAPGEWPSLLGALSVAFSLAPANGLMQRIAMRLFVREGPMDVGRMIDQAGRALQTITTIDDLLPMFCGVVARGMGTDRIALLTNLSEQVAAMTRLYAPAPAVSASAEDRDPAEAY